MKIYCRVTSMGIVPLYDSDLDNKKKLKVGTDVLVEIKKARNIKFHKKFFGLLRLVLHNMPSEKIREYKIFSMDCFLDRVKYDLKLYTKSDDGVISYFSIDFDHMDEYTFERFYHLTVLLMINKYIKCTEKDIEEEIYKFM